MVGAQEVVGHYSSEGILDRVLAALRTAGVDLERLTPDDLAPVDHLHARGIQATQALATALAPTAGERVLDIGCGVGGPARWIAFSVDECAVVGIDLTPAFCALAERLNELTGLSDRVAIECGDALDLPFEDAAFAVAYSQYVIMNVADKPAFVGEAARVVKPGGRYMISAVTRGPGPEPTFPLPWASRPDISYLGSRDELRADLDGAGFEIVDFRDCTAENAAGHAAVIKTIAREGPPALSPRLVMGDGLPEAQRNSAAGYASGALIAVEALCRRR